MASFHVDSDALTTASHHIHGTIDRIGADVHALTAQLAALDASWSGPAATAFRTLLDDWNAAHLRMDESLRAIGDALTRIHAHYVETETTNLRLLGQ
ncbi:MAG: hypothetical protein RL431_29 [Actinomycetota bacterium]|jgi:WXG100 family type VII secretion target